MKIGLLLAIFFLSLSAQSMESEVRNAVLKTPSVSRLVDGFEKEAVSIVESAVGEKVAGFAAIGIGAGINQEFRFKSSFSGLDIEGSLSPDKGFIGFSLNF